MESVSCELVTYFILKLAWDLHIVGVQLATLVISPLDETSILSWQKRDSQGAEACGALEFAQTFIAETSEALNQLLGAGPVRMGMIQGSRFCGAVMYDEHQHPLRGLISPEELTASMVEKLIKDGTDE